MAIKCIYVLNLIINYIVFGRGQILDTQCDHIPGHNQLPLFEPRTYKFVPADGIKAWLRCDWTFETDPGYSIITFIRVVKTGPSSNLLLYDNDTLEFDYQSGCSENKVKTIQTSSSKLRFHFYSGFATTRGSGFEIQVMATKDQEKDKLDGILRAEPEQRFLTSPRFPRPYENNKRNNDIVCRYLREKRRHNARPKDDKTENKTVCLEKAFRPKDGFFYFRSTEVEVSFESNTGQRASERGFVIKYRSDTRIRLNAREVARYYTSLGKDPEGFDMMFFDNYRGRGIYATWPIGKNDFVLKYSTSPLLYEEPDYSIYLFEYSFGDDTYWLNPLEDDGTYGRLLNDNHINPNAESDVLALADGKPHLCIFATKDINIGDEITYSYGDAHFPWRKYDDEEDDEINK